jgi:hypothetical protein
MPRAKKKPEPVPNVGPDKPAIGFRVRQRASLVADDATLDTIFELASIACTQDEVARLLGCALRTFQYFMEREPQAREAYEQGLATAKQSVRRKMLNLASTQSAAAIFLGKNLLGMKDVVDQNVNLKKDVRDLTEDELMEIARRELEPKPAAPKDEIEAPSLH